QRGPEQFNFLFRGPNPLTPDPPYSFNYKSLCEGMESAAMKAERVLQKPYRIIDINLMQWENADEVPMILTECKFFRDYSDLGELMGAYYLRWLNKSWAEMNALNFAIANRAFGCNNYRATLWYCIYLVEALQFKLDYRQAFKCYDPGDPPEGHYACDSPDPGQ